jgi:hypothetical protein
MMKKLFLISLVVLAFSVSAFAGEGSDTIGACRLMPELRYAYYETPVRVDSGPSSMDFDNDWRLGEHNVTLQVNYGLSDYVDVFAFAGGRIAAEKTGDYSIPPRFFDQETAFDLGSGFIGGVGIKGTFYRAPNGFYFGGGMSFTYAFTCENLHLKDNGVTVAGLTYRETDAAITADLHAGWHIGDTGLTPYLGVEYRWNQEDLYAEKAGKDFPPNNYTTEAKNPVGVYVGLDYLLNNRLYFNLEGQMIKRWGGSFSVGYLFDLCPVPVVVPPPVAPPIEPKLEPMSFK